MTEIKSYGRPPALVEKVMEAVMILRGGEPTWAEAKRQLGEHSELTKHNMRTSHSDSPLKRERKTWFDPGIVSGGLGRRFC